MYKTFKGCRMASFLIQCTIETSPVKLAICANTREQVKPRKADPNSGAQLCDHQLLASLLGETVEVEAIGGRHFVKLSECWGNCRNGALCFYLNYGFISHSPVHFWNDYWGGRRLNACLPKKTVKPLIKNVNKKLKTSKSSEFFPSKII